MSGPVKETAYIGDTQRFECQVVGFPTPNIIWFKDNINITHNPRYNIGYDETYGTITLMMKNVTPADEGMYVCRAENTEGYALTTAHLVVKVSRGEPMDRKFTGMTTEKLSEEEFSQIEVIKSNRQTIIEEVITRIEETEKEVIEEKSIAPEITYNNTLAQGLDLKIHATLFIEIDFTGYPTPKVSWFHGDTELEESARISIEVENGWSYLKVKNIASVDGGQYRVMAENVAGLDEAKFDVFIKGPPSPPRNLHVIEVNKDYIVIGWEEPECDGGDNITEYIVQKSLSGGMYVNCGHSPAGECQYKVTKLFEGNQYLFQVAAVNRIGESEPTAINKPVMAKLPFDPPGPPRNLSVKEYSADFITIQWEKPEFDGGSPIVQYIIEKKDTTRITGSWTISGTVDASVFTYKAANLYQGNSYLFRVSAENRVSVGEAVELDKAVIAKLPYDRPNKPRNVKAVETSTDYIVITWEPPEHDGGSPLTNYVIEKRDVKRPGYIYICDVDIHTTKYKVTKLFEGYEYYFRVMAENDVGTSDACEMEKPVKAKLPYDEPSVPRNLKVTDYWTDFISLSWEPPESDGGQPLTGYIIEKRDARRSMWVKAAQVSPQVTNFKAENLFEGTDYYFRVFAENSIGPSLEATELDRPQRAKMPFDPPTSPENLRVTDYNVDHVILAWDIPSNDGGSEVLRYVVERRDTTMKMWTQAGSVDKNTHTFKVDSLFEGQSYLFRVSAENQCGRGPFDELIKPTTAQLPYGRPSTPRDLRVTDIWRDYIGMIWAAPESDGGSPITGYNIEQRDAYEVGYRFVASVGPSETTYQASNLQEGHEYYFRLFSQNVAGLCEKPAEIKPPVKARLPFDPPGKPRHLKVCDVDSGSISLSWQQPDSDGGSAIIHYIIEIRTSGSIHYEKVASVDGKTTEHQLTGLDDGGEYYVRVLAENQAGISKNAAEISKPMKACKPVKPPGTPENLRMGEFGKTWVTVQWDKPTTDGGSDVTGYVVYAKKIHSQEYSLITVTDADKFSHKALGLVTGEDYWIQVRAQNAVGESEIAAEMDKPVQARLPFDPPSPPLSFWVTKTTMSSVSLEWQAPVNDGGSPLLAYDIDVKLPGKTFEPLTRVDGDVLSYMYTKLEQNTEYHFQICAENEAGLSLPTKLDKPIKTKARANIPSEPHSLEVTKVTLSSVTLEWKQPTNDGGAPITQYVIERKVGSGEFTPMLRIDGDVLSHVCTKLEQDTEYNFRVRAENEVGVSASAAELTQPIKTKAKAKAPASPGNLHIEQALETEVVLEWAVPTSDGGAPILKYLVEKQEEGGDWVFAMVTDAATTTAKVGGLQLEKGYNFRVAAKNEVGDSYAEVNKPAPVKKTVPTAPQNLKVGEVTATSVELLWEAPVSDGNAPLKQYIIVNREATKRKYKKCGKVKDGKTTFTVTSNIEEGHDYYFRVYAENSIGISEDFAETEKVVKVTDVKIIEEEEMKQEEVVPVAQEQVEEDMKPEEVTLAAEPSSKQEAVVVTKDIQPEEIASIEQVQTKDAPPKPVSQEEAVVANEIQPKEIASIEQVQAKKAPHKPVEEDIIVNEIQPEGIASIEQVQTKEAPSKPVPQDEAVVANEIQPKKIPSVEQVKIKEPSPTPVQEEEMAMKTTSMEQKPDVTKEEEEETSSQSSEETVTEQESGSESQSEAESLTEAVSEPVKKKTAKKEQSEPVVQETESEPEYVNEESEAESKPVTNTESVTDAESEKPESVTETEEEIDDQAKDLSQEKKKPVAPKNLQCVSASSTGIKLTWEAADEQQLKGYIIVCRSADKKKFKKVGIVAGDQTTFTCREKIKEGGEYFFRVYAESSSGISDDFAELEEGVKVAQKPKEPVEDEVDAQVPEPVQEAGPVEGIPEFLEFPEDMSVQEGETIKLACKVKGDPDPEITWLVGGKKLKKKKDKRMRTDWDMDLDVYTLEVMECTVEDSTEYAIMAHNAKGEVSKSVSVKVEPKATKPKLSKVPNKLTVKEDDDLKLSCQVSGNPRPELDLTKDGVSVDKSRIEIIEEEETTTFIIKKVSPKDSGKYSLTAKNSEGTISHDIKVKVEPKGNKPEFKVKPESVNVKEESEVKVSVTVDGTPEPSVEWKKSGETVTTNSRIVLSSEGSVHILIIAKATLEDTDEYSVIATNTVGKKSASFNITVDVKTESERDDEILAQLSPRIQEEADHISPDDKRDLFKQYPMLQNYTDPAKGVLLRQDDIVEVLDTENEEKWLVRRAQEKDKVCYVPVEYILGRQEPEKYDSDAEEVAEEEYPVYAALADYSPTDSDYLPLKEGDLVEVMDTGNSEKWFCRLASDKNKQGWVPPGLLVPHKAEDMVDKRRTQEQFRDDVLKIENKEKEAVMKRRYALKDLWESEREYVKDLSFAMDNYYIVFSKTDDLPPELEGQSEAVFGEYPQIQLFHKDVFLEELMKCTNEADSVANVFLNHREEFFGDYVPYFLGRDYADLVLSATGAKHFLQSHDKSISNVGENMWSLPKYLSRPWERIDEYIVILQDFVKYSLTAKQDTTKLGLAIEMLYELKRRAMDHSNVLRITGYPGELSDLGKLLRHDDFIVWEGEATGKGKERHLFLFEGKLILTKKIKAKKPGDLPTYEFKEMIELKVEYELNEDLPEGRRFELWYVNDRYDQYTFQARSVPIKQVWCDLLRKHTSKYDPSGFPQFTAQLQKVAVDEGESGEFVCKVYGSPHPDITWMYNGKPIKEGKKFKIIEEEETYTLRITKSKTDMAGKYTVRAKNKRGVIENSADLIVRELVTPSWTKRLEDAEVKLGEDAIFSCEFKCHPEAKVTWLKNGGDLTISDRIEKSVDGNRHQLTVKEVCEFDLHLYSVKVVNKAGEINGQAKLFITDLEEKKKEKAPAFETQIEDVLSELDVETKLQCKISGYPAPEINWQFKGTDIKLLENASNFSASFDGRIASLTVRYVHEEEAGMYTCSIKNHLGSANCSGQLIVGSKPNFTSRFSNLELFKGENAEFKCSIVGHPKPEITWYFDKKPLTESGRFKIYADENNYRLVVNNVLQNDQGEYSVRAVSSMGEASCSANMSVSEDTIKPMIVPEKDVGYAPSFTKKLTTQEVIVGAQARFICKAIGEPAPTVKWIKKGKEVETNERVRSEQEGTHFMLLIQNVTLEDQSFYTCLITNKVGENKCSAELLVTEPVAEPVKKEPKLQGFAPIMPLEQPTLKQQEDDTLNIHWNPASLPKNAIPTDIKYIIEFKDLSYHTRDWEIAKKDIGTTSFSLKDYVPERDYLYRIRAVNEYGQSDPSIVASYYGRPADAKKKQEEAKKEKIPPKAPKDKPHVFDVTDDSLKLSWLPSEMPDYAVQTPITYIIERRCPPSRNWIELANDVSDCEHHMKNYRPEKDYMFRVRACNDYGTSDPGLSATMFAKPADTGISSKKDSSKSKVKPRTVWDKPDITDLTDKSCVLKWKPSSIPDYAAQVPIWYIVEQRMPPNLEWVRLTTDCKETEYKTRINRKNDYYFRVRPANEFGMAEPSMPAMLKKIEEKEEPKVDTTRRDSMERRRSLRRSMSKELDPGTTTVPAHLRIPPEFMGSPDAKQYGVETRTSRIVTNMRAYPEPKITWYFMGHEVNMTHGFKKYTTTLSRAGELTLEIRDFSWQDVGSYEIKITNDFGSASQTIYMDMADPPTFLEPLKDQVFHLRHNGKLECRVHGIPYPIVQLKHDWRVIADSHRLKIVREDYDHWTLNINNSIHMDEGLYECVAENIAGKVYCTANVKITEKPGLYRDIRFNNVPIEDYFHVIDELARGSYGVVRRVIDKNSGNQYAAKFLRFGDQKLRDELETELEMMSLLDQTNIVQIVDGYEDKKRLIIVMEIVTGGELLQRMIRDDSWTESEAAFYIRQLLLAVEYMHAKNVIHLDLKPENMLLLTKKSDVLKVIDFGYARRYNANRRLRSKYGTPEFVAPEVAAEDIVTPAADMWSIGVIAYILLSGLSPFHQDTPRETLLKVKEGKFTFDEEAFANISTEAKDFISKLLVIDPKKRMGASEAINHTFIDLSNHRGLGDRIHLDRHRAYIFRRKWECGVNMVKTIVTPRPLSGILNEPVIQNDEFEFEVPMLQLPEMDGKSDVGSHESGAAGMLQVMGPAALMSANPSEMGSESFGSEWGRAYEDEDTWYDFSSAYQSGADTHLLPSRDNALGVRMLGYRRQSAPATSIGSTVGSSRNRAPRLGMRQRQDLRDLSRETEEYIPPAGGKRTSSNRRSVWQLKTIADDDAMQFEGFPPIFKKKIKDKAYNVGDSCTLNVHVIGNPPASVSWYRNDELLTHGGRVLTKKKEAGHHELTVLSTKPNDFGVYKCVARNKYGTVTCRARMLLGDHASRPGRPHVTKVSDKEVFMIWEEPEHDGNSFLLAYRVDWHKPGDDRWTVATYCIDECAVVKGLKPDQSYRFRVCAVNKFGLSPYSWASVEIRTKKKGADSIDIDHETKKILLRSRQATSRPSPETTPVSSPHGSMDDLSQITEKKKGDDFLDREIHLQEIDPEMFLQFGSEVWRGRFTVVRNVKPKKGHKVKRVAKLSMYDPKHEDESMREFDILKGVRQENIVRLYEAFLCNEMVVLIFEKLYGEHVARSLSLKNKYNEHHVSSIIKQILDGLQFLHHRGIVHLNIQPDNVVMVSRRRFEVKLIDFGRARRITTVEGGKVDRSGTAEFMAPEKVTNDNVGVAADIWGVGALAFILLSGTSPFRGETDEDTFANICHVRYDAHALYHNATKYALKFLYQILRHNTKARLTLEECLEHRWLMLNQPMVKVRRAAIFPTDKLRLFAEDYSRRREEGSPPQELLKAFGSGAAFSSDEEEDIFDSAEKW